MVQPPGFESSEKTLVCKLNKALYGLKQSPRALFDIMKGSLLHLAYSASGCDPSLFIDTYGTIQVYMLVYVVHIIVTGNNPTFIKTLVSKLNATFSLKYLGNLDYCLSIKVKKQPDGSLMYIFDLLPKHILYEAQPFSTPMVSGSKLAKAGFDSFKDPSLYRSVIGALQYATITCQNISFSVNKVCRFMANSLDTHWVAVKRIIRNLKGTISWGIHLKPISTSPVSLSAFCDADWGSDSDYRRSMSGACVFLGTNMVSW